MIERLLTRIFGPRCPRCLARVFERDQAGHDLDCS